MNNPINVSEIIEYLKAITMSRDYLSTIKRENPVFETMNYGEFLRNFRKSKNLSSWIKKNGLEICQEIQNTYDTLKIEIPKSDYCKTIKEVFHLEYSVFDSEKILKGFENSVFSKFLEKINKANEQLMFSNLWREEFFEIINKKHIPFRMEHLPEFSERDRNIAEIYKMLTWAVIKMHSLSYEFLVSIGAEKRIPQNDTERKKLSEIIEKQNKAFKELQEENERLESQGNRKYVKWYKPFAEIEKEFNKNKYLIFSENEQNYIDHKLKCREWTGEKYLFGILVYRNMENEKFLKTFCDTEGKPLDTSNAYAVEDAFTLFNKARKVANNRALFKNKPRKIK